MENSETPTFHRFHASLSSAFQEAGRVCMIWRMPESDKNYNFFQLEKFVKDFEAEHPCPEGCCYEVSVEGAIGYCPGRQYLTRWLFFPAMDRESITAFVEDMVDKLVDIMAEEEAAAPAAAAPMEPEKPTSAPVARFCPNCGTPYPDDQTRFCPNCGTPRE